MRSFITGVDGFIGSWLAETLRCGGRRGLWSHAHSGRCGRWRSRDVCGDMTSAWRVADVIAAGAPRSHFSPGGAEQHPRLVRRSQSSRSRPTSSGSLYLLEAVRRLGARRLRRFGRLERRVRADRGRVPGPLRGDLPLFPTSPYGDQQGDPRTVRRRLHAGSRSARRFTCARSRWSGPRRRKTRSPTSAERVCDRARRDRPISGGQRSPRSVTSSTSAIASAALDPSLGEGASGLRLQRLQRPSRQPGRHRRLAPAALARRPFEPTARSVASSCGG